MTLNDLSENIYKGTTVISKQSQLNILHNGKNRQLLSLNK